MFNRKYIFIQVPFSIAMLENLSVNYPHLIPTYCTSRCPNYTLLPVVKMCPRNHNLCSFQPKKADQKRYLACHHGTFAEKLIPRRPNLRVFLEAEKNTKSSVNWLDWTRPTAEKILFCSNKKMSSSFFPSADFFMTPLSLFMHFLNTLHDSTPRSPPPTPFWCFVYGPFFWRKPCRHFALKEVTMILGERV